MEGLIGSKLCLNKNWMVATQMFLIFTPKIGEMIPVLTNIFRWVGSTTN